MTVRHLTGVKEKKVDTISFKMLLRETTVRRVVRKPELAQLPNDFLYVSKSTLGNKQRSVAGILALSIAKPTSACQPRPAENFPTLGC